MQTYTNITNKIIRSIYSTITPKNLTCPELPYGRTKQSFKAETDINTIVRRFLKTGVLDFVSKNEPRYGDTTGIEFTNAMQTVAAARSMFEELPAALRARFDNEPAQFLDFVQDSRNRDEAIELGLMKPEALTSAQALAARQALPPSHKEDGSAGHEPLRSPDGQFREHTRKEKRDEARATRKAEAEGEAGGD